MFITITVNIIITTIITTITITIFTFSPVLHNFISVLEHRITELEEREQPTQQFLNNLKKTIEKMNGTGHACGFVWVSLM